MPRHYTSAPKYIATCKCNSCGKVYKAKLRYIDQPDPPCPSKLCAAKRQIAELEKQQANMAAILKQNRAPGQVGSITAKSIDATMQIVSEDYGLSNLKDNVRVGENAVVRERPELQERIDGFWGGGNFKKNNPAVSNYVNQIGALARSGALAPQQGTGIVDKIVGQKKLKTPYKIIAST